MRLDAKPCRAPPLALQQVPGLCRGAKLPPKLGSLLIEVTKAMKLREDTKDLFFSLPETEVYGGLGRNDTRVGV